MARSKGHLSERRAETVIRVAWTVPDLALYGRYEPEPIAEATGLQRGARRMRHGQAGREPRGLDNERIA